MTDKEKIQCMILQLKSALYEIDYKEEIDYANKKYEELGNKEDCFKSKEYWDIREVAISSRQPRESIITQSLRNVGRMAFALAQDVKQGGIK